MLSGKELPTSRLCKLFKINNKHIRFFSLISFFLFSFCVDAQIERTNLYFPIWTYHQKNAAIQGLSVGLWSIASDARNTHTNGVKLELIGVGWVMPLMGSSPVVDSDTALNVLLKTPLSEKINGLNVSATGAVCDCHTNGISVGSIGQINFQVNGVSISLLLNLSQKQNGIMVAFYNEAFAINGLQLGFYNIGHKAKGLQVGGLRNEATKISGVQIGIVNSAQDLKGFQIGIWNTNQKRKLPLFNWSFSAAK